MARILTGIQSSGRPHLGNILGAIKPAIDLSKIPGNDSFLFIADLHSLISLRDGNTRLEYVRAIASTWLAFGLDTNRTTILAAVAGAGAYRNGVVPETALPPMPMLQNATSFKDKVEKLAQEGSANAANAVNAGLFTYPVLQAADILLYGADIIPVGKDQRQHIEMTRDIAGAVNRAVGEALLVLPEPRIDERLMVIPGIDGAKMSKSYNNYIDIFLPENELLKVIKKIKIRFGRPSKRPKIPTRTSPSSCIRCSRRMRSLPRCAACMKVATTATAQPRKRFMNCCWNDLPPSAKRFNYYMKQQRRPRSRNCGAGEEKARAVAGQTIRRMRETLGFS